MRCEEVRDALSLCHDGEAAASIVDACSVHVEACESCRREQAALETISHVARERASEALDPNAAVELWERIAPRLERVAPVVPIAPAAFRTRRSRWVSAMAIAATLAAVVLGSGLLDGPEESVVAKPAPNAPLVVVDGERGIDAAPAATPVSNRAEIERLESNSPNVFVLREPNRETTAIFVTGFEP